MQRLSGLLLSIVATLAVASPAHAERYERFGPYEVHYNAVATGVMGPEMARRYGIVRSRMQGLLTVALRRNGEPVRADISAEARSGQDQPEPIEMREIREGGYVSYIGTFRIRSKETLSFRIRVRPYGTEDDPFTVGFSDTFFTDF